MATRDGDGTRLSHRLDFNNCIRSTEQNLLGCPQDMLHSHAYTYPPTFLHPPPSDVYVINVMVKLGWEGQMCGKCVATQHVARGHIQHGRSQPGEGMSCTHSLPCLAEARRGTSSLLGYDVPCIAKGTV
jgi:hypothetical protein